MRREKGFLVVVVGGGAKVASFKQQAGCECVFTDITPLFLKPRALAGLDVGPPQTCFLLFFFLFVPSLSVSAVATFFFIVVLHFALHLPLLLCFSTLSLHPRSRLRCSSRHFRLIGVTFAVPDASSNTSPLTCIKIRQYPWPFPDMPPHPYCRLSLVCPFQISSAYFVVSQ